MVQFWPYDISSKYMTNLEALLLATQKRRGKRVHITRMKKHSGKKVVPKYEAFPKNKKTWQKKKRLRKISIGMSIKRGCQRHLFAKQVYIDNSLYQLRYVCSWHKKKVGDFCHETTVAGFKHAMGSTMSYAKKLSSTLSLS